MEGDFVMSVLREHGYDFRTTTNSRDEYDEAGTRKVVPISQFYSITKDGNDVFSFGHRDVTA